MTLDPQLTAKAFTNMLILLGKMQVIAGHPLSYVLHSNLKGPNDANIDDETEDPPPFGQPGSPYFLIDNKRCCRAPILRSDLTHSQFGASLETLESDGPFEPSFLANMVTVYNILHACWEKIKLVESREEIQQDQERATSVPDLAHSSPWWVTCCVNRERHCDQAAVLQV
jgi:hypothetical protein